MQRDDHTAPPASPGPAPEVRSGMQPPPAAQAPDFAAAPAAAPAPRSRGWGWRQWLTVILLVLLLAPVIGWLAWDSAATSRWQRGLAGLEERGVPMTREALLARLREVPPEANAAYPLQRAADLLQPASDWQEWLLEQHVSPMPDRADYEASRGLQVPESPRVETPDWWGDDDDLSPAQYWAVVEVVLAEQSAALEALAEVDALIRPRVDRVQGDFHLGGLSLPDEIPILEVELPHLTEQRELSRLLRIHMQRSAVAGDWGAFIDGARRGLGQAEAIGDGAISLVESLVAIGTEISASRAVPEMLTLMSAREAAEFREELRLLINLLADETAPQQGFRRGLEGEALIQQDAMQRLMAGELGTDELPTPPGAAMEVLRPWGRMNAAFMAEQMIISLDALEADYPSAQRRLEAFDDEVSYWRLYASMIMPSTPRAVEAHFRRLTERRGARIALAVALYRSDHDGELPPSLDALVPDYLPALPLDPMQAGGGFGYDPARGFLWSAGSDGIDDGGDLTFVARRRTPGMGGVWERRDVPFPLTPAALRELHEIPDPPPRVVE